MHKTASTYIQRKLIKNRDLLRSNGILMPRNRKIANSLVLAVKTKRWKPWRRWLQRAKDRNCNLLVSHEALSTLLYKNIPNKKRSRGTWLAKKLKNCGWNLKIICYIRDQESYLNSRYTQLVKRLKLNSKFDSYVMNTMEGGTNSECDVMVLFKWLIRNKEIKKTLIPFESIANHSGSNTQSQLDPFEQFVREIEMPKNLVYRCKTIRSFNQQPGRLGVELALKIHSFLAMYKPNLVKKYRKQICKSIDNTVELNEWHAEPFQGLDEALVEKIRVHYQSSNEKFCRYFWPGQTWTAIFDHSCLNYCNPNKISTEESNKLDNYCKKVIIQTLPAQAITNFSA